MGRAEKYANVVKKYEEEQEALRLKEESEEEKEEKLSMTRELKFQTIQKKLDDTVTVGDAEEIVKLEEDEEPTEGITSEIEIEENVLSNTDTLEVETVDDTEDDAKLAEPFKESDLIKDEELISRKEIKKAKNEIEDDLYLTSSLKPLRKRFKLRKVFKVLFSFILIAVICFSLYFFGIKPIYNHFVNAQPRKVFENTIDYVVKTTKQRLEGLKNDNDVLFTDLNFKIDSNVQELEQMSNYYFGISYGVDPAKKKFLTNEYINASGNTYSIDYVENDGKAFIHLNPSENYISYGDVSALDDEEFYSDTYVAIKSLANIINYENISYFLDKESEFIKSLFEDNLFSKSNDEMDINGTSVKVIRNTLKLNSVEYKRVLKKYVEACLADEKYIEIKSRMKGLKPEQIKKELESLFKEDVKEDYELIFNIYTSPLNKVMGIDVSENGFRIAYLYFKDKDFAFHLNLTKDEDCLKGKDCVVTNQRIIDINGKDKEGIIETDVKYNGTDLAKLNIKSLDEKKDFDYELYYEGKTYKGEVVLLDDKDKMTSTFDVTSRFGDSKHLNFKGELNLKASNNFAYIKMDKIISEKNIDREIEEFTDRVNNKEIVDTLFDWSDLLDDPSQLFKETEKASEA